MNQQISLGMAPLTIQELVAVAQGKAQLQTHLTSDVRARLVKSYDFLCKALSAELEIYGVNTGYGDSCTNRISKELIHGLPMNLVRYHSCGMGDFFSEEESRAIQVARIASLVQGPSAVRPELIEFLAMQLQLGISPRIPKEGSVGASGDLTPLSYLAATLIGTGEVLYKDQIFETAELYRQLNIEPVGLKPKEGLAIMNGTAVMTGLACLAYQRADYLSQLASKTTALNTLALLGNPEHFDPFLFAAKPHPGQKQVANWIRSDFSQNFVRAREHRLQDRYSIRCAPHVIGVLQDGLLYFKGLIETELNSANDNPLIDVENERVVHGGNFYGGHIAFAMDSIKVLVANVADLQDRQLALLVDSKFNNGLPMNLSGAQSTAELHHGLKALQISASAWTAEALKNCMPVSVFSRSTECHNQDKVSMGTIAARDCMRVLELSEQVAAGTALAGAQGLQLRKIQGQLQEATIGRTLSQFQASVFSEVKFIEEDRPLDKDLRNLVAQIRQKKWELYS